ncbi:MAG: serine protease SohB [Roseibaca calidilacus]|uniref:Serine protease SohB n=2 Tax=Roseibaca calidilacus TaxID=1666912 RepID=A0A0N8K818_9RHOB|nr:MAG: serine protease SohB [Roseibaca calidilacus]CUX83027.1 serine protease SohB [Roseibaca calidilacus]
MRPQPICESMKHLIPFVKSPPSVAVIRLQGMIASGPGAGRLNDAALAPAIEIAFKRGKPKAVALVINSPGGSPVQSALIAARIRRLAGEHKLPVLAFVEDVAASGGYWLATAADEVFADANSILGSIGVISAGFGLHDLIGRYGVERRVYTSGTSKSQLDPFRPEKPEDVARLQGLLDQIHQNFIAQVKDRRGVKLADQDLFTGEFWLGAQAVELGLADGLGHLVPVLKDRYGDKVKLRVYGPRRPFLSRFGLSLMQDALTLSEERALYARFGL